MVKRERRTRIVATLGPVSSSPEMIAALIEAGVDVFRLNFSHGTQEEHGEQVRLIRQAAGKVQRPVAILQDLSGPKMRVGELKDKQATLVAGQEIRVKSTPVVGTAECISTTYQALAEDVRPGDLILLDDGRLQLRVKDVADRVVRAEVVVGGILLQHKGINLPNTPLSAPCLTEKDKDDLAYGLKAGVDFVGLSFVRKAEDIEQARQIISAAGKDTPIIAKIERPEAIAALDAIIQAADGVMVARGDLAVETSAADVPLLQKRILGLASQRARPDITATQMLETMISNPQPSRAEAADIANAVFDGTDALMLSGETAVGKYPVEAVRMMGEIAVSAEAHMAEFGRCRHQRDGNVAAGVAEATVTAACAAAEDLRAKALVVFTISGRTAFMVASRKPSLPVLAFTPREETYRRLALAWGVRPILSDFIQSADELVAMKSAYLLRNEIVRQGDLVVMLCGSSAVPGATNIMKVHRV